MGSYNILPEFGIDNAQEDGAYETFPDMPLQLLLYFNVYLSPFWFLTSGLCLCYKFHCLGNLTKFLSVGVLLMYSSIECLRLYLGYVGNLSEQIPELAGFWMLSVLLQLPLLTFLLTNPYLLSSPIELTLHAAMWILLISQMWTGFQALRVTSSRAKKYYALKSKPNVIQHSENHRKSEDDVKEKTK